MHPLSHRKRIREAEKWASVSPWSKAKEAVAAEKMVVKAAEGTKVASGASSSSSDDDDSSEDASEADKAGFRVSGPGFRVQGRVRI